MNSCLAAKRCSSGFLRSTDTVFMGSLVVLKLFEGSVTVALPCFTGTWHRSVIRILAPLLVRACSSVQLIQ